MSFIEERQIPGEIRTDKCMNSYTDPLHLIDISYVTAMANEHVEIGRETLALLVRTIVVSRKKKQRLISQIQATAMRLFFRLSATLCTEQSRLIAA